jgi:AcrR family transcriptional regulator
LSVRRHQKEATRSRVLDAARDLFDTVGYEATTVRAIARQAGVSVGSVFTTFAAKGEILSHVMQERLDGLYSELDRVAQNLRGSTADRLRSIFAIHYSFEAQRARLFLAHIAAAFDWSAPPHVHSEADLEQVIDLLLAAYAWTYRLAAWEKADVSEMSRLMDRQIGLIANGYGAPSED